MKFDPLKDNFSLPQAEERILGFWDANAVLTAKNEALQARQSIEFDLEELKSATKSELDKVRFETDTGVKEIRRLKEEAQQHIIDTKEQAKEDLEEIAETKKRAAQHAADIEAQIPEIARMIERAAAPAMVKPAEPDIHFEERLKLIETADAQEAVAKFEQLVADMEKAGIGADRIPVSLHKNIGSNYMALKKWPEAIRELQTYFNAYPLDHNALYLLSASLIKLYYATQEKRHLEEVLKAGSRALGLAPRRTYYNYNVACGLALLERKGDMLAALKEAIAYDNEFKKMARKDEDFTAYWDDPDFRALTAPGPEEDQQKKS